MPAPYLPPTRETPIGQAALGTPEYNRQPQSGGGIGEMFGIFLHSDVLDLVKMVSEMESNSLNKPRTALSLEGLTGLYDERRALNARSLRGAVAQQGVQQSMHGGTPAIEDPAAIATAALARAKKHPNYVPRPGEMRPR
jgi:hypothetical protein